MIFTLALILSAMPDAPPTVPPPAVVGPIAAHACPCLPSCHCNPCRCNDVAGLEMKVAGLVKAQADGIETIRAQDGKLRALKAEVKGETKAEAKADASDLAEPPVRPSAGPAGPPVPPLDPDTLPRRVWVPNEGRYGWGVIVGGYFQARYGDDPTAYDSGPEPKMTAPVAPAPAYQSIRLIPAARRSLASPCANGRCPR